MNRPVTMQLAGLRLVLMSPEHPEPVAAAEPTTQELLPLATEVPPIPSPFPSDDSPRRLVEHFVRPLFEILQGRRPPAQARLLCSADATDVLAAATRRLTWTSARVSQLRADSPADGVVEAVVVVDREPSGAVVPGRVVALGLRLERGRRGWSVTHLALPLSPAMTSAAAA